jgi:hypothetical protein
MAIPPPTNTIPLLEAQRKALSDWLVLWRIDQSLGMAEERPTDIAEVPTAENAELAASEFTYGASGETPKEGDIVLLPPIGRVTQSRPVYVALLERRNDGWLAIPFARLPLPATDAEFATGRKEYPLRVLAPWNSGVLTDGILARAWKTGRLRPAEISSLRAFKKGGPSTLEPGPPLVHPLDPRHDYLDEERELWVECAEGPAQTDYSSLPMDYPEAAEDPDNGDAF